MSEPAPDVEVPPDVADQDDVLSIDEIDDYADVIAPGSVLHAFSDDQRAEALAVHAAHGWQIGTTRQAEWAMAQIRATQAQIDAIDEQANERIDRIRDWQERVAGRLERRQAVLEGKLLAFTDRWHQTDPDSNRTLVLPSGEVPTRQHHKPTVVIDDEHQAAEWATRAHAAGLVTDEQLEACVRTETKVFISGLRKVVAATLDNEGAWVAVDAGGNIVPGMRAEPPAPTDIGPVKPYRS